MMLIGRFEGHGNWLCLAEQLDTPVVVSPLDLMKTKIVRSLFALGAFFVATAFAAAETPTYTTAEAASHIGETATICGKVAGTHHSGKGNTFVNLDGTYPNQPFTAFIPAANASVGADVRTLEGKNVSVTGKIALYKGKPEIVVTAKEQIQEK
jgi:hypothetical protein